MQLLWINVFLDIAAVVAITTGPPIKSLLETAPYTKNDGRISLDVVVEILYLSTYQIISLLTILFFSNSLLGLPFRWDSPVWLKPEMLKTELYANKKVGDPSNKTIVFTMIVHSYVLMQCANLIYLKIKDEQSLSWRQRLAEHPTFVGSLIFIVSAQCLLLESGIKNVRLCPLSYN
jgi:magnesium-transporting ATPase (P-type)